MYEVLHPSIQFLKTSFFEITLDERGLERIEKESGLALFYTAHPECSSKLVERRGMYRRVLMQKELA